MAESKNNVIKGAIDVLSIIEEIARSEMKLRDLVLTTGWELDELVGFNMADLTNALAPLSSDLQDLLNFIEHPPDSFSELDQAFDKAQSAFNRITQLKAAMENVDLDGPDKDKLLEFTKDLLNILIVIYLRTKSPLAFYILHLLTLVDFDDVDLEPIARADGKIVRHPCLVPKLRPGRLGDVFSDPVNYFGQYYFPNGLQTDGDALMAAHKLFPRVANILHELKINTQMGFNPGRGVDVGIESNELANGMFTIFFEPDFEAIDFGLSMILSPAARANLGLVLIPFGNLNFSKTISDWQYHFSLTAGTEAFALGPEGATLLADAASTQIKLGLKIVRISVDAGQPAFIFGGQKGSRLEIGELILDTALSLDDGEFDIDLLVQASKGKFVLKPGDGDGFLAKALPPDGIKLDFDLGLGWSKTSGLYFKGSAGLEAEYIFHHSFLGILELQSIRLKLALSGSALSFIIDSSLKIKIGPVTAIIREIGIKSETLFVEEGGNAGIANNRISFKPPSGVGLSLDAGGFKGGGFLRLDSEKGEYVGALELDFNGLFSIKAIGIINTKMPDGKKGFSLLIVIAAEFTPIQLTFGFTLNGVGGIFGLNRRIAVAALAEGIRTNAIKSILFPENVVANITRIISDIKQFFPQQKDHFVIGPMAKLGWGTPSIITVELGLLLDLPDPMFAIVGVLKALLPKEEAPILRLQVNFIGVVDFDRGYIFFRADLFDSRLLVYSITGSMAFLVSWGEAKALALSVGGFHPDFRDIPSIPALPDGFRRMARIGISLLSDDNPRLKVESYFAITANTVQFGARVELYAEQSGFNIYGFLGFDVLFQFDPFHFVAKLSGGVALRRHSSVIAGVNISATLTGPTPWDARGKATLSFLFFSISVGFHHTWGDPAPAIAGATEDLLKVLQRELADTRNWRADLPSNNHLHVSVRKIELPAATEMLVIHPAGVLTFSQRSLPLENFAIAKFGNKKPLAENKFKITNANSDNAAIPADYQGVREQFAPANFLELTDSEKLTRKSFDNLPSGFKLTATADLLTTLPVVRDVDYELSYLRRERIVPRGVIKFFVLAYDRLVKGSAVRQSRLAQQQTRVSLNAPLQVGLPQETFAIASAADLKLHVTNANASGPVFFATQAEAYQQQQELIAQNPALAGQIQVVSHFELNLN